MSMRMIDAVRQHSRAKGTALNVLVFLAWYANDDGIAWPSQATLAEDANVTERRIRDALTQLVALGEIVRVVRGRRATVTWQILLPAASKPGSPAPDLTASKPGSPAPDLNSNPEASRFNPEASRRKSGGQLPPNLQEPSKEPVAAAEQAAVDLWNKLAASTGLKPVAHLTAKRRDLLRARLAECGGCDGWSIALLKIEQTPGLRGHGNRGFQVSFDWLLDETNFAKLMEGRYDDWGSTPTNGGHAAKSDRHRRVFAGLAAAAESVAARRRRGP